MTSFTRTWNAAYEAVPADTDDAAEGALRIRNLKEDVQERGEVDHSWAGDANDGAHKKVTLLEQAGNPSSAANTGFLYTKDVAGITELFWEDSSGNILQLTSGGATFAALLAAANIFTGVNTIRSTDGGAGEIVALDLDRASGTPANNDLLMALRWLMRDAGAGTDVAAKLLARILDVTAGSEDAQLDFFTVVAGTLASRMILGQGLQIGAPTGGDKGAGTVNADVGLYVDGNEVSLGVGEVISGTSHSPTAADNGKVFFYTSGSTVTVTVPAASGLPVGWRATFIRKGAGQVNLTRSGSDTLISRDTALTSLALQVVGDGGTLWADTANTRFFFRGRRSYTVDTAATASTDTALAHGLGVAPTDIKVQLVNTTANLNYSVNDVVELGHPQINSGGGFVFLPDATNLNLKTVNTAIAIPNKTTFVCTSITAANWNYRILAVAED